MRIILDIDDDVLRAAKEVARRERKTAGQVISVLARSALAGGMDREVGTEFGFRPFPPRGGIVTNSLIDSLREDIAL